MHRLFVTLAMTAAMAGCTVINPTDVYSSLDTTARQIAQISAGKYRVTEVAEFPPFDGRCRETGLIKPAGNRTFGQFVRDAINDEFRAAEAYSGRDDAITLVGAITDMDLSSFSPAWWRVGIRLENPHTGRRVDATTTTRFETSIDGATGCGNTAFALTPAIQQTIRALVASPDFPALLAP